MKKTLITTSILLTLGAQAHKHHDHDNDKKMTNLGAHVHGEASLNVVLEGDDLTFSLESPAMNIIGFEHKPETDEQFDQSHEALHRLKDFDELVVVYNSACKVEDADIDWKYKPLIHERYHANGGHDKHDHDKHDHDKHDHDKHDHDKHDHDKHDHDKHDHENHSDIDANFVLECDSPEKIYSVKVELFEAFPKLEKLNVQWIAGGKQGATTLTKDQHEISFK